MRISFGHLNSLADSNNKSQNNQKLIFTHHLMKIIAIKVNFTTVNDVKTLFEWLVDIYRKNFLLKIFFQLKSIHCLSVFW